MWRCKDLAKGEQRQRPPLKEWGQRGEDGPASQEVGDTVPHWAPEIDRVASLQVESSKGWVQRKRIRGAGEGHVGGVPIQKAAPPGPGTQKQASRTRPSNPGTSLLTSLRTHNIEQSWRGSFQVCKYLASSHHEKHRGLRLKLCTL